MRITNLTEFTVAFSAALRSGEPGEVIALEAASEEWAATLSGPGRTAFEEMILMALCATEGLPAEDEPEEQA